MSQGIRTIVVGIASAQESEPVLAYALSLAGELGATLHVVHAFVFADPVLDAYARMGFAGEDIYDRYSSTLRQLIEKQVAVLPAPASVVVHAAADSPVALLRDKALDLEADLLVVGATHRGPVGQQVLGTTADRVIRESPVPVLLLRTIFTTAGSRVLFATDLSPFSAAALERGIEVVEALPGGTETKFDAVLVVPYRTRPPLPLSRDELRDVAATELERLLRDRTDAERPIQAMIRFGSPSEQILAEAAEPRADLIVVGTHGRSGLDRLVTGSVATAVLRDAPGNVLVIPPRALEAQLARYSADAAEWGVGRI